VAGRQDWRTSPHVFAALEARFGPFVLDAAADKCNALCPDYYTEEDDGLTMPWRSVTFCNPGFASIHRWVEKAAAEAQRGVDSVVLGPAAISQAWWHVWGKVAVCYHPVRRVGYCLPDGTPQPHADRDTVVLVFGPSSGRSARAGFDVRSIDLGRPEQKRRRTAWLRAFLERQLQLAIDE